MKIVWNNRFRNNIGNTCLVTVDGTDFRINEPTPFWPGWKSFKFNGPGVRYEVAVCIRSGDLVWINGPFPCGHWPDLKIFRHALVFELQDGEKVEADKGYRGEPEHINTPNSNIFLNDIGKRQKAPCTNSSRNNQQEVQAMELLESNIPPSFVDAWHCV